MNSNFSMKQFCLFDCLINTDPSTNINFEMNPSKMGILCEMCIQLHLEDQVEFVNKKMVDVKELYNLKRNCYGLKKENKSFNYELGKNVNYAYWMSPE